MRENLMDKTDNNIDICLEDLTYTDEPLEVRIVVLSRIFKELGIPYKRYYTKKTMRSFKRVKRPDVVSEKELTVTFTVTSDKDHVSYAIWLYKNRMEAVMSLYKMYFMKSQDVE